MAFYISCGNLCMGVMCEYSTATPDRLSSAIVFDVFCASLARGRHPIHSSLLLSSVTADMVDCNARGVPLQVPLFAFPLGVSFFIAPPSFLLFSCSNLHLWPYWDVTQKLLPHKIQNHLYLNSFFPIAGAVQALLSAVACDVIHFCPATKFRVVLEAQEGLKSCISHA